MELHLEVMLVTSIKRRKPWPRFCWLGQEKEAVFVLDHTRISEIDMASGRTKRRTPKLQPLLPRVVAMAASHNGAWLAGLLLSGEVFLWNKDRDFIKTVAPVPAVCEMATMAKERSMSPSLLVSGDGRRLLLAALTTRVFLWECVDARGLGGLRDGEARGRWAEILPPECPSLPSPVDREACLHCAFVQGEALGDCCLSAFAYIAGNQLGVTFLKIRWEEGPERRLSPQGYSVRWATQLYPLDSLHPPCRPVKSRGGLLCALSPDGLLLAVTLNQRDPRATQVLFISTQNLVSVPSWLGGCGSRDLAIPAKCVRSYWVADVSWSAGGLFLACVLKRGSLLLLARLGGLLSLSTSGCSVELGPAHFLPLHPLVTYRPPQAQPQDASPPSSCASAQDVLRQRYSVSWHPQLACLVVSDGYTATVLRIPRRPSAAAFVGALLLDAMEALEVFRQGVAGSQGEALSTLKLPSSLQELRGGDALDTDLPRFLLGGDSGTQAQVAAEEDSDDEGSQLPGPCVEMEGRLEFASMFDTLHAYPDQSHDLTEAEPEAPPLLVKLSHARRSLLTAWALGVSLGGAMEHRARLLRYAVRCALRYAVLLRLAPFPASRGPEMVQDTWLSRVLNLLQTLLYLLSWDMPHVGGATCLGVAVELTEQVVRLLLSPQGGGAAPSSYTLSTALLVLTLASQSLDQTYWLPQRTCYSLPEHQGAPSSVPLFDVFSVSLLREAQWNPLQRFSQNAQLMGRHPSRRLLRVWQELYTTALQCADGLCSQPGHGSCEEERHSISDVLNQVQRVLQAAGAQLEGGPTLYRVTGEQHFLTGSYADGVQAWVTELLADRGGGPRSCFLETRYCLALLYSLLFRYRLREAQGFCDQLAQRLVRKAGLEVEDEAQAGAAQAESALTARLQQVNSEAIYAVVQSLGRFMASYFTNQPLAIMPPHCVDVLPPLHLPPAPGQRLVPLSQISVTEAVRSQELSGVWTVGYALDLLLLGGLLPEAAWFARRLGDWKTAVSLGVTYTGYCRDETRLTGLRWKELHLPGELNPRHILQAQLECVLGMEALRSQQCSQEEEDDHLQASVQDLLRAAAMAGLDVLSQPLRHLVDRARMLGSCLPALVPGGLYLPAPPLYCPQPAPDPDDPAGEGPLALERLSRLQVSAVLQRVLLLLRAARCCVPAAQWYTAQLRHCRRVMRKIRKDCSEAAVRSFPDGLMKFISPSGFVIPGSPRDGILDSVTVEMITCFRELCGLCWMLHVRDQLSVSCRKYQAARNHGMGTQLEACCVDALRWGCRLLPFARFLNAEEVLQDVLLSLASALPPVPMVTQVLSQAFPDQEDSVRVSLREKYSSLLQRLGENQAMASLIEDQLKKSRRDRSRVAKYLGPPQRHLWEREEETGDSQGASLSCSTLTDCGDTADTGSETASLPRGVSQLRSGAGRTGGREDPGLLEQEREPRAGTPGRARLPPVGTWVFELDDDEYLSFLELFLSYVLEKDSVGGAHLDPPLLSSYTPQLWESELHSLTFDMMTTLRRRCARDRKGTAVFRPGRCYRLASSGLVQGHSQSLAPGTSVAGSEPLFPGLGAGKSQGLFGLHRQARNSSKYSIQGPQVNSEASPWLFEVQPDADLDPCEDPDPGLDAQFPSLSRLLEWMMRWSDRKVSHIHSSHKRAVAAIGEAGVVFIRAKTSAPAVLSALKLLTSRYSAALLDIHFQVPLTEATVTPVLLPEKDWCSEDTECCASSGSPPTPSAPDPPRGRPFGMSLMEAAGPGAGSEEQDPSCQYREDSVTSDLSTAEEDDRSTEEPSELLESLTRPDISVQIRTVPRTPSPKDQTLTLADLDYDTPPKEAACGSPGTSSQADELEGSESPGARGAESGPERTGSAEEEHSRLGLEPSMPRNPKPLPRTSPQLEPCSESVARGGPATEPQHSDSITRLLQDELFRLVQLQQINFMGLMQTVGMSFTNLPHLQYNLPHLQPNLPHSQANLPQLQPNLPHLQPNLPHSQANLPHLQYNLPHLQPNLPQLQPNLPHLQPNLPHSQANLPQLQPNLPHPQPDLPHLQPNLPHPQPNLPHPQSDLPHPQPNLPQSHFTLPLLPHPVLPDYNQSMLPQLSQSVLPQLPTPVLQHNVSPIQPNTQIPAKGQDFSGTAALPKQALQDSPVLAVDADWSQISQMGQDGLLPASSGLLRSVTSHAPVGIPLLLPQDTPEHTLPTVPPAGLPLLQLHSNKRPLLQPQPPLVSSSSQLPPPSVREAWGPGRSGHLPVDPPPPGQVPWSSPPRLRRAEPYRYAQSPVLPLLRFHSDAPPTLACPPAPSRSFPGLGIRLLRTESEFHVRAERPPPPPLPTPRLIPLEELAGGPLWGSRQLLLLTAERQPLTAEAARHTAPSSAKRQRRRKEKRRERGDVGVTFMPEESVTAPPAEVCAEGAQPRVPMKQPSEPLLMTCDPVLTGQELVAKAWSTAAELHAFACTQKAAPEVHDACTSTDPASPISLADKAVSAKFPASLTADPGTGEQREAAVVPPDIFLDLRFPQDLRPHGPETQEAPAQAGKKVGRGFINVIDLEDVALLRELPPRPSLHTQDRPRSPPPSSQLHLLAASVANSAPAELPVTNSPVGAPLAERPPVGLAFPSAASRPGDDAVVLKPPAGHDAKGQDSQGRGEPDRWAMSRRQAWSRLSEMDAQLSALQSMADHMEREFANSRMLVRTIDTLGPLSCEPPSPEPRSKVGVKVAEEASRVSQPPRHIDPEDEEVEEEEEEEGHQGYGAEFDVPALVTGPPDPRTRFCSSPLPAAVDGATYLSPPSLQDLGTMATGPGRRPEESLNLSGLSDVGDILGELLRDGAMSATSLGLSHTQAARLRRQGVPQASQAEEEQQEVQVWMRSRQRERLAEYRKQREERMEQERKPFRGTTTLKPTSRDITLNKKVKEEKDRAALLQHHSQRAQEACNLMADLLTASQALPVSSLAPPPTQNSTRSSTRVGLQNRSKSTGRAGRSHKSPAGLRSLSSPGRVTGAQASRASRLGLHRPAKALPSDRLSQVTQRGMLTRTRDCTGRVQAGIRGRTRLPPQPHSAPGAGGEDRCGDSPKDMEDRDVVSPWEPPLEIRRLLGLESLEWGQRPWSDSAQAAGMEAGFQLDSVSESTGSILSKLDWAAVEGLLAGEGSG
ncbi:ciliogenesis and planar polarity effector 1 isoform X2 [Paramormyrops kingsleyae]|uniref:ciliogenesis and planar polarity effector 1 isoform X2 n=1 Tax=Paramormyrops kingsleyae TaxID=1676925 RepID=UPI003B97AD34